ncbi:STAS domain-containing protein [Pseudoroseomonas cervicalis]|uniref:STAS domain protein n=1 Tax=Pseudoroseomonas cervicalis ATCC 49957 TaxID=525371 RepID=D5RSZ4_9PROT|nr:STAS domain-containing protein [Pseudoroseomonas cervicalis]EFH09575.1 STAS domain protein [Pseudoroseomonas cervicalis ATCC 49957]
MQVTIHPGPDAASLAIAGALTFDAHAVFRQRVMAEAERPAAQPLVLDLAGLDHIDSAGLGMLLLAREVAAAQGRGIVLRGARGQVARILAVSKFHQLFTLQP